MSATRWDDYGSVPPPTLGDRVGAPVQGGRSVVDVPDDFDDPDPDPTPAAALAAFAAASFAMMAAAVAAMDAAAAASAGRDLG